MTRVKPRLISLMVDDADRSSEVSKSVITSAPADWQSIIGGERQYALTMTLAQDHAAGTLWDAIWSRPDPLTHIDGVYAPYGNEDATADQPHYSFTAIIQEPDGDYLGSQATSSLSAVATIDVIWPLLDKPTKVTS